MSVVFIACDHVSCERLNRFYEFDLDNRTRERDHIESVKVLFTGASSKLGAKVLERLAAEPRFAEFWCTEHRAPVSACHPKLRRISLDLASDFDLAGIPGPLDLVVHFAAVTHARTEAAYWKINAEASARLFEQAHALGCRRVVHISTHCAGQHTGAYGKSKLAAEKHLLERAWDSLLIIRPSEVYGGDGREGIDQFLKMAAELHVVPMLFGHRNIEFSPLHFEDFVSCCVQLILTHDRGVKIADLRGPDNLSGVSLALRIARRHIAVPLPIWLPALRTGLALAALFGLRLAAPDQMARLIGPKSGESGEETPAACKMRGFLV